MKQFWKTEIHAPMKFLWAVMIGVGAALWWLTVLFERWEPSVPPADGLRYQDGEIVREVKR